MAEPAPKAKLIAFLLHRDREIPPDIKGELEVRFGASLEFTGGPRPFEVTDYYRREFGSPLFRVLLGFSGLVDPAALADYKTSAAEWESRHTTGHKRNYNLDPGYLDADKLVLASFKPGPCKIYLRDGVYADMLMHYAKGSFAPSAWAFADFQDARYSRDLLKIRERYKQDLKEMRSAG